MISRESIQGGFPCRKLGEIVEFLDNRRRPITASNRVAGPYPYYGANGKQDSVADYIFDEPLILLAEDGGLFDQPDRGIAYAIDGKTWVNNHAHVVRPSNAVSFRYLLRALENYDVMPWITGATRAKLTKKGASEILVPVPPLEKQTQIAEILDEADELRKMRRESLALLDDLLQSAFLDLFGDPVTNPKGWESATIEDVVAAGDRVNYGVVQPGDDVHDGASLIRVGDFISGELDFSKIKCIDPDIDKRYSRSKLNGSEVLISCVGSIGNICKVPAQAVGHNIARAVARVPVIDSVDRDFMVQMLRTKRVQDYFIKETRTVSQPTLNISLIKSAPIFLPPLKAQRQFADFVREAETQWSLYREQAAELDTLFASLQFRAFCGEL